MRRLPVCLCPIIASCSLVVADEPAELVSNADAVDRPCIVTLGDSITKGVRPGVKPQETFASLVEASLRSEGLLIKVINVGIGGERTDQALKRLGKDVLSHKPVVVTIMYGTNDSYIDSGKDVPRLPIEQYQANLEKIVDDLRAGGAIPVLMTEPRFGMTANKNGVGQNPNVSLERYVQVCRAVAKSKEVPLVDNHEQWMAIESKGDDPGKLTTDQCHPNPEGHKVLAAAILPVLKEALAASSRARAKTAELQKPAK